MSKRLNSLNKKAFAWRACMLNYQSFLFGIPLQLTNKDFLF